MDTLESDRLRQRSGVEGSGSPLADVISKQRPEFSVGRHSSTASDAAAAARSW